MASSNGGAGKPRVVATYDYRDEQGALLYQSLRYEPGHDGHPKTYKQRRPDGKGGWIWKLEGVRRVLYRLLELLAAEARRAAELQAKLDRMKPKERKAARNRRIHKLAAEGLTGGQIAQALRRDYPRLTPRAVNEVLRRRRKDSHTSG
jgi:hypothetical protein